MADHITYITLKQENHGWSRYGFQWGEREMELLTIDNGRDPPRSQVFEATTSPSYNRSRATDLIGVHLVLDGIITVQAAYQILCQFGAYEERGRKHGAEQARAEIRKALGL